LERSVLKDHYDEERDKTVFHNTKPDLQDQDQDRSFWSQTGLVLIPTVLGLSLEIIMTMSVTRPCFITWHQTCKTKTKTDLFGLRPVWS